MVVVTINILVKLPPFLVSPHKVKRRVSLQHGGLVYCVVLRRRRIDFKVSFKEHNIVDFILVVWYMGLQPASQIKESNDLLSF